MVGGVVVVGVVVVVVGVVVVVVGVVGWVVCISPACVLGSSVGGQRLVFGGQLSVVVVVRCGQVSCCLLRPEPSKSSAVFDLLSRSDTSK